MKTNQELIAEAIKKADLRAETAQHELEGELKDFWSVIDAALADDDDKDTSD